VEAGALTRRWTYPDPPRQPQPPLHGLGRFRPRPRLRSAAAPGSCLRTAGWWRWLPRWWRWMCWWMCRRGPRCGRPLPQAQALPPGMRTTHQWWGGWTRRSQVRRPHPAPPPVGPLRAARRTLAQSSAALHPGSQRLPWHQNGVRGLGWRTCCLQTVKTRVTSSPRSQDTQIPILTKGLGDSSFNFEYISSL
jgi:hypothetical protein